MSPTRNSIQLVWSSGTGPFLKSHVTMRSSHPVRTTGSAVPFYIPPRTSLKGIKTHPSCWKHRMGSYWKDRGGSWSPGPLYELPKAALTNSLQLSSVKPYKLVLPQFWRPEVRNPGVGQALLPPEALEENPSLPLPAPGGCRQFLVLLGLRMPCSNLCFCHPVALFLYIYVSSRLLTGQLSSDLRSS